MKYLPKLLSEKDLLSLPMQGEWIEMVILPQKSVQQMSLPMQGEWIEIPPSTF